MQVPGTFLVTHIRGIPLFSCHLRLRHDHPNTVKVMNSNGHWLIHGAMISTLVPLLIHGESSIDSPEIPSVVNLHPTHRKPSAFTTKTWTGSWS